jgi:hypothetical protein
VINSGLRFFDAAGLGNGGGGDQLAGRSADDGRY